MNNIELSKLLNEKLELLMKILEATEAQTALIDKDDTTELMDNISLRQELIDRINELDAQAGDITEPMGPELDEVGTKIRDALAKIMAQDKRNEARAKARMDEIRRQMKSLKEGHRGTSAYMNDSTDVDAVFFNKQK